MAEIDLEASKYVRDILKRPTDRDQQRTVGASQLSSECTKCLAEAMVTGQGHQSEYNMGAIVGTAIHEYLEHRNRDPKVLKEYHGLIDVIPGYGEIGSTTDLYRIDKHNLVDFKTTTRDKLEKYLRDWQNDTRNETIERYFRQASLYAYMLEAEVKTISIAFICRDGQVVDRDVVVISRPYDERIAVATMNRAKRLWKWLEENNMDWQQLNSHEGCYVCNFVRPLLDSQEIDDL